MDYIVGFLTSKLFIANCIFCVIMLEYGLNAIKPLYPKNDKDRERDEYYRAFKRNDLNRISRPILYLFVPFMPFRWLIGIGSWTFCAFVA